MFRNTRPFDPAHVDSALGSPERVERGERVVTIEAEVPREVVPGPERDADEGQAALDRDRGHRCERAVASGHPERVGLGGPGDLLQVLSVAEEMHLDASAAGLLGELVGRRAVAAGAWIDDQEAGHGGPGYRPARPKNEPNGPWRPSTVVPIIRP